MTRSIEPASTSVGWPPPLELLLGLLLELPLGLPEGWPAPRSLPEG